MLWLTCSLNIINAWQTSLMCKDVNMWDVCFILIQINHYCCHSGLPTSMLTVFELSLLTGLSCRNGQMFFGFPVEVRGGVVIFILCIFFSIVSFCMNICSIWIHKVILYWGFSEVLSLVAFYLIALHWPKTMMAKSLRSCHGKLLHQT